jgi:hypothetical protein
VDISSRRQIESRLGAERAEEPEPISRRPHQRTDAITCFDSEFDIDRLAAI